jgi:putative ABC transport system substrate-binding protein
MPVIGLLDSRSPDSLADRLRGFRQGLKESGYIEGENLAIVYRFAENQTDRLPDLAADLVRRQVAVIATGGPPATFAAKAATTTIPTIFVVGDDPVRLGLVASLSRPGGNLTGINIFTSEVAAKRLALLRDLVPRAARVAVLVNPADATVTETQLKEIDTAARAMGLQIRVLNADTSAEIDAAFEALGRERPDAVFVATTVFLNGRRVQLAQLAAFHRLPATYGLRDYAEAGGLMSYGSNIVDGFRQAGVYTGRILKGARSADLPVVRASKFELVINAQTARMLGLTVPDKLLVAADEVIE